MAMQQDQQQYDGSHWSISLLGLAAFGAIFLYSGWQTAQFVWTLFPDDQLTYRFLGVLMIDGIYLVCLLFLIFYKFRDSRSKTIVQWMRGITFALSLIATGLYLFFFNGKSAVAIDQQWIMIGRIVIIFATMGGVLASSFVLQLEIEPRTPKVVRTTHAIAAPESLSDQATRVNRFFDFGVFYDEDGRLNELGRQAQQAFLEKHRPQQQVVQTTETGPMQRVSAHTEKHPRNCYCTSCRPQDVRTTKA